MTTSTRAKLNLNLLAPVWKHLTTIAPVRAEGIYLYDADGNRYMDFTSGIGVTNTGHCHPRIVQAIREQAGRLIFGQMNVVIPPPTVELAEKLNELTPPAINRFFFSNSGAEAVEAAVKLSRHATGRRNIIVLQGGFHGRTHQAMAMTTSKHAYRYNYQPLPGGIFVAPFPYAYYYGWDEDATIDFCLKQFDLLLKSQTAPDETAAVVLEPVLGEGGYVPAPDRFLQGLRERCDRHGFLLVLDEIQSGFGRTGRFFCYEYAGIEPDILIMAKGMASGMPISAIGSRADLMERWVTGTHGGTYGGGNALAAAAANATIDVLREERLAENAAAMGAYLMSELAALQKRYPVLGNVRGRGLMVGVEFTNAAGEPDENAANATLRGCLNNNLLLLTCGSEQNVIRWIPPLVVNREQIDEALKIFAAALSKA
jgi:4-aminobutyrate aminotransferase